MHVISLIISRLCAVWSYLFKLKLHRCRDPKRKIHACDIFTAGKYDVCNVITHMLLVCNVESFVQIVLKLHSYID